MFDVQSLVLTPVLAIAEAMLAGGAARGRQLAR
jgi:hypothetical protein